MKKSKRENNNIVTEAKDVFAHHLRKIIRTNNKRKKIMLCYKRKQKGKRFETHGEFFRLFTTQ